jgi:AAA family ATP:ADP antiporter
MTPSARRWSPRWAERLVRRATGRLARLLGVAPGEAPAVCAGFSMFFLLFTAYFALRPVRETLGVTAGVDRLQWLFTGTFLATLLALPCYGWVAARVSRPAILPAIFGFFAANLLVFAAGLWLWPGHAGVARAFYVWLSVFNLVAISLAWSVLVDAFSAEQGRRLFGLAAAGASLGGIAGPLLALALVGALGHAGLLLLATGFLLASIAAAGHVRAPGARRLPAGELPPRSLGGGPLDGAREVLGSSYLLGIAAFTVLLACVSTFLYFEQARQVAAAFPDPVDQTRVFGSLDAIVQGLSILAQLFVTGQLARRLGAGVLLVAVPLVAALGLVWLALAPGFAVLAVVMVLRRAGEYAFVRPGREMLYSVVPASAKYRAKQFNDTVVYRGADALAAWLRTAADTLAQQPAVAAALGAGLAVLWALSGGLLARRQRALEGTVGPPA